MIEYAQRDIEALGEHYIRHIEAMTDRNLSSKSDIAAELAFRDDIITNLKAAFKAWDFADGIYGPEYDRLIELMTRIKDY